MLSSCSLINTSPMSHSWNTSTQSWPQVSFLACLRSQKELVSSLKCPIWQRRPVSQKQRKLFGNSLLTHAVSACTLCWACHQSVTLYVSVAVHSQAWYLLQLSIGMIRGPMTVSKQLLRQFYSINKEPVEFRLLMSKFWLKHHKINATRWKQHCKRLSSTSRFSFTKRLCSSRTTSGQLYVERTLWHQETSLISYKII